MRITDGRADIRFLGGFRVNPSDLVHADLVVGQGRTVLEAIGCGVPAAVCGVDGYCGLLRVETFSQLAYTNLTGRDFQPSTSLLEDIRRYDEYVANEFAEIRQQVIDLYDAKRGAAAMEHALALAHEMCKSSWSYRQQLVLLYMKDIVSRMRYWSSRDTPTR
jgi:hypothetical protein